MDLGGIPIVLQISGRLYDVIFHGGWVGSGILAVLTGLSLVSWTIMIEKARFLKRSRKERAVFISLFQRERRLKSLADRAACFSNCPEAELARRISEGLFTGEIRSVEGLDRLIDTDISEIMAGYESYMQFLATTASISPLLGLFGTVWGIMGSFLSMGAQGSASLFVVGPGIAVALITTIFGLGAAIPAVVGYNFILRNIRNREDELSSFATRLRNRIVERIYADFQAMGSVSESSVNESQTVDSARGGRQ